MGEALFIFFSSNITIMRKRLSKRLILAVLMISFLALPNSVILAAGINAQNVIELANKSRSKAGLPALVENEKLNAAARDKAQDMVKHDYFAHTSPAGKTPWHWLKQNDYKYKYAGENLAINYDDAAEQHTAWMKSQTHRDNILNANYQEIGIAVLKGKVAGNNTLVTVEFFGTAFPVAASPEKKEIVPVVEGEKIVAAENIEPVAVPVPKPLTNLSLAPVQLAKNEIIAPAPRVMPGAEKKSALEGLNLAWVITFIVCVLSSAAGLLAIAVRNWKKTWVLWQTKTKTRETFALVIISQQDEILKNFWQDMQKATP